jgi:ATP-dependent Zn protease
MKDFIAYHEAGHAVACLQERFKFHHVTIIEDTESNTLGHLLLSNLKIESAFLDSDKVRLKVERYIKMCLAGSIAETRFTKVINNIGASKDFMDSFQIAANMFGDIKVVNAFMDFMLVKTKYDLINSATWKEIKLVAKELIKRKTLSYKDVLEILPDYK